MNRPDLALKFARQNPRDRGTARRRMIA
eukprot:COSAG02_NODE_25151_length_667_cov_1.411972_1_plen_27_part_10